MNPNLSEEKYLVALEYAKLQAAYHNQTLAEYLRHNFRAEIAALEDVNSAAADIMQIMSGNKRGGMRIVNDKALLYGSPNADIDTIIHELTHVFTRTLKEFREGMPPPARQPVVCRYPLCGGHSRNALD